MAKKRVKKRGARNQGRIKLLTKNYTSKLVLRDLGLSALFSLLTYILYLVSNKGIYKDTFALLAMIFGFMALAFLIVWLVIFFSKGKFKSKKKRKSGKKSAKAVKKKKK